MNRAGQAVLLSIIFCLILAAGVFIGWRLTMRQPPVKDGPDAHDHAEQAVAERKVLYWYDPMMPQQHFDHPGKSPFMDMELVAKYADEDVAAGLRIDPLRTENIGMRLAPVSRIPLVSQIEASGLIAFNDRDVAVIQARSGGFVERVTPLAAGDLVKAGQAIAELMQPEWAAAQQEWLVVREMRDQALLAAASERLRLLGMPESLIRRLQTTGTVQNRFTVTAPITGVIQSLDVRNGMAITSGQTLARINGLASVWLEIAVPEAQIQFVSIGAPADVHLTAFPEHVLNGKIAAILPALNESSRSARVRIELPNSNLQLHPGMSARVRLRGEKAGTGLAVPTEALIRTGKRTLVMLADEQGRFFPREVTIGQEVGESTVIVSGLDEGSQVVASGQFLIDSEASLSGIEAHSAPANQHLPSESP